MDGTLLDSHMSISPENAEAIRFANDAGIEFNNYGFHIDECQFNVRTPSTLMRFKDCDNIARSYNSNVSLLLQVERIF